MVIFYLSLISDRLQRWFYDLPKIGKYLRAFKYRNAFSSLKEGEIAIDCGANVGSVTRKMLERGVRVYAFEPDPYAFKSIESNLGNNSNLTLINKAVSDHNGTAKLHFHKNAYNDQVLWSRASSLVAEKGNVDQGHFVEVEVIDFVEFISGLKGTIGLLKMDIEGEEVKVLNALIDAGLVSKIRNIVVETHERIPVLKKPTMELRKKILSKKIKNIDMNWA